MVLDTVGDNTVFNTDTGEVIAEPGRLRLVRGFTASIERVLGAGMRDHAFRLIANKQGRIVSALGPVQLSSLDMAFPGCGTSDEITVADEALNRHGLTRGNSPAGRALDYAIRTNASVAQWRMRRTHLQAWATALYGGIQFGGNEAPAPAPGRISMDINSSYPFLATERLPRIRDAAFERGYKRNSVLLRIEAEQSDRALFSRREDGTTEYGERVSGWYARDEVDYHVAMGRLKLLNVMECVTINREEKYLAPTIERLYTARERYARGTVERGVIKSGMNGLLGKFAAPISPWRTPRSGELEELQRTRKLPVLRVGRSALVNDASLTGIYPRHANVLWTVLTYARARVRLWQKFDELTAIGGRVLWAHTDSVVADVPIGYVPTSGTALGDWRLISPTEE